MTKALSKADFFSGAPRQYTRREVALPELGGSVWVRRLGSREQDDFEQSALGKKNIRARLVVLCAVDEEGRRLFADDDADEVGRLPVTVVSAIAAAALEHNAMSPSAREELEKNS